MGWDRDELLKRLADPILEVAIEILNMISRTPQERLHRFPPQRQDFGGASKLFCGTAIQDKIDTSR
jgi:hypothetical protein